MEPAPDAPFLLFVYGTLMRDGRRHGHLAGQRFLGAARTRPLYDLLDLGAYPGLVADDPGRAVEGELYEVDPGLRGRLDAVEGAPALFRLGPVALEGESRPAFAYFYQRGVCGVPRCPATRWPNRRRAGGAP